MAITNSTDRPNGLGLDVGEKRIGVAVANLSVRFARPLTTLENPVTFLEDIVELARAEEAAWIVVGLPRGLDGQATAQTAWVQAFGDKLIASLSALEQPVPVYWTDEALTSRKAEEELKSRGKPYAKGAVDALAATYILDDYLIGVEHG